MNTVNMKKSMQNNSSSSAFLPGENPQQLITVQHLDNFHKKLITDIEGLIDQRLNDTPKRWLRSYEVRKMLNISPGTLQHLKATGTIAFSKIGGSHYYDYQKIQELLTFPSSLGRITVPRSDLDK
jgi:hypothetical protein